jgi:signal transduction histidine kinase
MSLGRLSAGLAHELNNPASAAARSGRLLAGELTRLEETSRALGAARLGDAQMAAVTRLRQACISVAPGRSPIERVDREEAIAAWLERHGAAPELAGSLVDTSLSVKDFDSLAAALDGTGLSAALEWLAADCTTRSLAADIERAATRMHSLVAAVKRSTHMDRAAVPEAVDLAVSLNDSVTLLQHKARGKSATLRVDLEPDLPRVLAIAGDLSQIWTNLIDNALDAIGESGHVTITGARRLKFVVVGIADDGPGIPAAIRDRIFDPFITTKPVGQGTGLGLDIVRRLVGQNGGDIDVESAPGRTMFRVTLPIAAGPSPAPSSEP